MLKVVTGYLQRAILCESEITNQFNQWQGGDVKDIQITNASNPSPK